MTTELASDEVVRNPVRDRALIAHGRHLGRKEVRAVVEAELRVEDDSEACCGRDNSVDLALRLRAAITPLVAEPDPAGAELESAAVDDIRARVEAVIAKWVGNRYFIDAQGRVRHVLYNELRAALDGTES